MNPLPTIAGVLVDFGAKKVLSKKIFGNEMLSDMFSMTGKTTFKSYLHEQIQPKLILSEEGKMILLLANPQYSMSKLIQKESFGEDYELDSNDEQSSHVMNDEVSSFKISLETITLPMLYKRMFYGPDPAILIDGTILLKGSGKGVLRLMRDYDGNYVNVKGRSGTWLLQVPDAARLGQCS